jgi:hypothetical protein
MIHHDKYHGNGAQENGKLVKVVVGDHLEDAALEPELGLS